MSERYCANINSTDIGADLPHCSRYLLARGFVRQGETVVDAACSCGYGSRLLAEVAGKVISIDKDDVYDNNYRLDKMSFIQAHLEKLEEYPKCDTWVSIETIEHLADPQKYLDKVTKATSRCIVMSSPNKETKAVHEFHLSDVLLVNFIKMMEKYPDWFHYQTFIQGYTWISVYVKKDNKWLDKIYVNE